MTEIRSLNAGDRRPAEPHRQHSALVREISADIVAGRIKASEALPSERQLGEKFKVSRATVREALLALKNMGLVEIRNGTRARVISPTTQPIMSSIELFVHRQSQTVDGVRHLQHARALLEIGLAREAAIYATDADKAEIRRCFRLNENASGDQSEFTKTDIGFHFAIAEASHNPIFLALHQALFGWLAVQRDVSSRAQRTPAEVIKEHGKILDAISRRDGSGAANAMEAHLAAVVRAYWQAMTPAFARQPDIEGG